MPSDSPDLLHLLSEFDPGGLELLTAAERAELDQLLMETPQDRNRRFLDTLPLSVRCKMLEAIRRLGVGSCEVEDLDLPPNLKDKILHCQRHLEWTGERDPPQPWQLPKSPILQARAAEPVPFITLS